MAREPLSDHMPDVRRDPELRKMIDDIDDLFDAVFKTQGPSNVAAAIEALKLAQIALVQAMFHRARTDRAAFEALIVEVEAADATEGVDADDDGLIIDLDDTSDASDPLDVSFAVGTHLDDVRDVVCDYDLMVLAPRSASVPRLSRSMCSFGFKSIKIVPQSVWAYTHKLQAYVKELKREAVVIYTPGAPTRSLALFENRAASRRTMPLIMVRCESLRPEAVANDLRVALGMISSPVVQRDPNAIEAIQSNPAWRTTASSAESTTAKKRVRVSTRD